MHWINHFNDALNEANKIKLEADAQQVLQAARQKADLIASSTTLPQREKEILLREVVIEAQIALQNIEARRRCVAVADALNLISKALSR